MSARWPRDSAAPRRQAQEEREKNFVPWFVVPFASIEPRSFSTRGNQSRQCCIQWNLVGGNAGNQSTSGPMLQLHHCSATYCSKTKLRYVVPNRIDTILCKQESLLAKGR